MQFSGDEATPNSLHISRSNCVGCLSSDLCFAVISELFVVVSENSRMFLVFKTLVLIKTGLYVCQLDDVINNLIETVESLDLLESDWRIVRRKFVEQKWNKCCHFYLSVEHSDTFVLDDKLRTIELFLNCFWVFHDHVGVTILGVWGSFAIVSLPLRKISKMYVEEYIERDQTKN